MNCVVIGLGFGDEGKGITTDYLCSQFSHPLVIRFSGGHQSGHTAVNGNTKHVFSNFGSGTLRSVPTFWSKFCTIDPIGIINEISVLKSKRIFKPQLFIDKDCPVTTPYDKNYNQITERKNNHRSCGVGFGATLEREKNHYSLKFNDLFYPKIFEIKLQMIMCYYYKKYPNNPVNQNTIELFKNACKQITELNFIEQRTLESIYCSEYVFEGSQGLLLDQNFGFFPYVTRTNCGSKNIIKLIKDKNIEYFLVTRAYQVRHGNGPMTNENHVHNIKEDPEETNIDRPWQGKLRRSLLDIDLLEYAISKDENIKNSSKKTLVITCLDHIVNEYRFTYKGEIIYSKNEKEFITKIAKILSIRRILTSNTPDSKNFKKHIIKF